jgi:DNA-binding MarR family transcriptional regulator
MDFLGLAEEARILNPDIFSITRFQILANLAAVRPDEVPYRDLKNWLKISDGALFTNLKALEKMGYISCKELTAEGKRTLSAYTITQPGYDAWILVKEWLKKLAGD